MERVSDLGRVEQYRGGRHARWSRQVQHSIANCFPLHLRLPGEPLARRGGRTALDSVGVKNHQNRSTLTTPRSEAPVCSRGYQITSDS